MNIHLSFNRSDPSPVQPVSPPAMNPLLLSKWMRHSGCLPWGQPGTELVNPNPLPISAVGIRPHKSSGDATSSAVSSASVAPLFQAQRAAFTFSLVPAQDERRCPKWCRASSTTFLLTELPRAGAWPEPGCLRELRDGWALGAMGNPDSRYCGTPTLLPKHRC